MNKTSVLALAFISVLMASCIASERENTECDIEAVSLHLDDPTSIFDHEYDTLCIVLSTDSNIVFPVSSDAEVHSIPTYIRITDKATAYLLDDNGAEIPFVNGTSLDYSDERVHQIKVVSEDKVWSRNYILKVIHKVPSEGYQYFNFEDYFLDEKYYVWNAPDVFMDKTGTSTWKNGNPGFKISRSSAQPMDYPTTPVVGGGPDGSDCVKLETCDTGPFGKMVNMRIASGSLFNGVFDVGKALTANALKSTLFGLPFAHKPSKLRVWLRYEVGRIFQDRSGKEVANVIDEPDAYIVLYRNEDAKGNPIQLDGENVLTSPYIVGLGRLPHHYRAEGGDALSNNPIHGVTNQWQEFVIPVEYRSDVDADILSHNGYSLIIGFASSWQGAYFMGAIGSKLYIDNVQLFCEEDE